MKNLMGNFALKLSLIEILLLGSYFVPYFCNNGIDYIDVLFVCFYFTPYAVAR